MADDFRFGVRPEAHEVSGFLRERGVEPAEHVHGASLDPSAVSRREGHHAPPDEAKAGRISREHGHDLMPILVVNRGGHYELVDGVHRARAAEIQGTEVPALVMTERAFDLTERFGNVAQHRWAHDAAGTGWDP